MHGVSCVGRRRTWWIWPMALVVPAAAVVLLTGGSSPAAPQPTVCSDAAASESAAASMAKRCGRSVRVDSATSEYAQVEALPSGLLELEQSIVPVRVRRGNGWTPVDTTLRARPDGSLAPQSSTADLRFSRGGRDPLVTLSLAEGSVVISWPGELPRPSLTGDTAVYAEVLPDVDLRVRATATGFTHVLVVKSAAAAASPVLRSIRYGWSVRGLSVNPRADGGLDLSDATGVVVSMAPGSMWDSATAASNLGAAESDAVAPGGAAKVVPVGVTSSESELVVTPDLAMLADPTTVFPVYIDPPVTANRTRWGYTNTGADNNNDGVARIGRNPDGYGGLWRSFFEFDVAGLKWKTIYDAKFYANVEHTSACDDTQLNLWTTSAMEPWVSGTRNGWSPLLYQWLDARQIQANGGSKCLDPTPVSAEWANGLAGQVKWWADNAADGKITLGLTTGYIDSSGNLAGEDGAYKWAKVNPSTARLVVSYNTHPNPPVPQDFSLAECATACRSTVAESSSATQAKAWWKLDETSGSTAADATGAHRATAAGSYSWSDGGIAFTGGGDLYTSGPVLETTKSFTVSAWAKLTNTNGYYTMVSQDGNTSSAFWLRFDHGSQRWAFIRAGADTMYPSLVSASAPVPVRVNAWVHVVGVYTNEPREKSITIYVDGMRYETVWADPVFGATGPLLIGRAKWLGALNDRFVGGIDNVQVYQRRLTDDDVTKLYQAGRTRGALNISPALVRTTTPDLRIQVSDNDADAQVKYGFEIYSAPSETAPVVYASGPGGPVGSSSVVGHRVAAGRLASGTTYYWRARVEDELSWSSFWSPFQALRIDTSRPSWCSPPVSSAEYPEREYGLVSGNAGRFGFCAASTDVTDFEWWVDNQSVHNVVTATGSAQRVAAVTYTPPTPGIHTMHVRARDSVGLDVAYDYEFWVGTPPNVYAHWKLDEASGTVAADSGNAPAYGGGLSPLALSGAGVRFGPGYLGNGLVFSGDAAATAAGPVLDTTREFTVMAWVKPADLTTDRTLVSQDGGGSSRFELYLDGDADEAKRFWCVRMRPAANAAPVSACTDGSTLGPPVTDRWIHVAAVFNPSVASAQLRIYVMGDPESCWPAATAAVEFVGDWSVTGAFVVGRAQQAGASTQFWRGGVDDVRAYQRALRGEDVCQIIQPSP